METISALRSNTIRIWKHEGFQKYFKNTSWMFAGRIFSLAISFFVGIYIARYLGPMNYGLMNYAISFVGLFGFMASLGIDEIVNREIVKDHDLKDKIIGTAFFIKLFGSFSAIFSIFIISILTANDFFTFILIILFSLHYIPQAFNVIETYFQSQVLSKNVVKAQILSGLISAVLKLLVIFLNKGIFWLLFIYVFEIGLIALFLVIAFLKSGHHFKNWRFDKDIAKSLLSNSWPIILSSLSVGIYMKIDQVMINQLMNNESTGIYAVAVKLSEIFYIIPVIIASSVFPAIVSSLQISNEKFENRIRNLYFLMFWLSTFIAIVISLLSNQIVDILFGEQYQKSAIVLQIYTWTLITVSMGTVLGKYLITKNLTKVLLYTATLGAISNILLNIILIPRIGLTGAALSTIISYLITNISIILFKQSRPHFVIMLKSIFVINNKV